MRHLKPPGERLLVMSPIALRAACYEWFLRGFEESGFGFHGEVPDLSTNKPLRRLVSRRFTKLYLDRHKVK